LLENPVKEHPAVPREEVEWLNDVVNDKENPLSFRNGLLLLRQKLFPFEHNPHHWMEGS
jgi:hypothetical protein